jgi:hypothetical protein
VRLLLDLVFFLCSSVGSRPPLLYVLMAIWFVDKESCIVLTSPSTRTTPSHPLNSLHFFFCWRGPNTFLRSLFAYCAFGAISIPPSACNLNGPPPKIVVPPIDNVQSFAFNSALGKGLEDLLPHLLLVLVLAVDNRIPAVLDDDCSLFDIFSDQPGKSVLRP